MVFYGFALPLLPPRTQLHCYFFILASPSYICIFVHAVCHYTSHLYESEIFHFFFLLLFAADAPLRAFTVIKWCGRVENKQFRFGVFVHLSFSFDGSEEDGSRTLAAIKLLNGHLTFDVVVDGNIDGSHCVVVNRARWTTQDKFIYKCSVLPYFRCASGVCVCAREWRERKFLGHQFFSEVIS